jgi:hypothetical protein
MVDMFRFFKKEEKPVVENHDFLAKIYTRNMGVIDILGYYESAGELADRISYLVDNFVSFTSTNLDGNSIVIKSKDVEFVEVIGKPFVKNEQQEETASE